MAEQRYQAVLAVISDGETVRDVAARFGVSRQTVHSWLAKYEAGGLENLGDGSHRPRSCPHQMDGAVEVELVVLRRRHPSWGPRRLVYELAKQDITVSESAVYRALVRGNLIDPAARRPRDRKWKRWERGRPMELWQMDVVGGFVLANGQRVKALTGVDDRSGHSVGPETPASPRCGQPTPSRVAASHCRRVCTTALERRRSLAFLAHQESAKPKRNRKRGGEEHADR